ncbi:hypothetical protein [Deinococcus frigens]|uniref:hypothetical protein n=1 Tax=Deinococcus frigens TaxID=249403 RepID=UPI00068ED299|nr:hypothetical protein [Deinococcus frigens]
MKPQTTLAPAALLTTLLLAAQAQTSAQTAATALPAPWTTARLATATYVILDPQMTGPSLIGGSDQSSVLAAMRRDSGGALKRRYPGATISADAANPQAIRVTPVLKTPSALLPWLKLTARLDFALPEGERISVGQDFTLWDVYQHRAEAANFVYDQLAQRLP